MSFGGDKRDRTAEGRSPRRADRLNRKRSAVLSYSYSKKEKDRDFSRSLVEISGIEPLTS